MAGRDEKATIVTGGGNGLGRAIGIHLGATGYPVVIADIDRVAAQGVADEITEAGGTALALAVDVRKADACAKAVEIAEQAMGGLYGVVNNAGVGKATPFKEMTEEAWDWVFDVNVKGVFLMSKAATGALLDRQRGSIVNLSSIAGKEGYPNWSHYGASKHAIIGLTRALARELGADGVRVNAVCPGGVKTDIWSAEAQGSDDPDALFDALAERTALGRNQSDTDIAEAVEFLLDGRSRSITGQALMVDSGLILS